MSNIFYCIISRNGSKFSEEGDFEKVFSDALEITGSEGIADAVVEWFRSASVGAAHLPHSKSR